jgi:hypothetical protein
MQRLVRIINQSKRWLGVFKVSHWDRRDCNLYRFWRGYGGLLRHYLQLSDNCNASMCLDNVAWSHGAKYLICRFVRSDLYRRLLDHSLRWIHRNADCLAIKRHNYIHVWESLLRHKPTMGHLTRCTFHSMDLSSLSHTHRLPSSITPTSQCLRSVWIHSQRHTRFRSYCPKLNTINHWLEWCDLGVINQCAGSWKSHSDGCSFVGRRSIGANYFYNFYADDLRSSILESLPVNFTYLSDWRSERPAWPKVPLFHRDWT